MNEEIIEDIVTPVETAPAAPAEKLLTQEQVNALVGREKAAAADKARREVQAQYQAQMQQAQQAQQGQQAQQAQGMGGMAGANMDEIYQQVESRLRENAQRQAYEDQIRRVADTYLDKMASGPEMFEDFNNVMQDFDPSRFPSVVYLVSEMENVPQIMYELANNPMKLASIHSLAQTDEKQAKRALQKLSQSISQNESAKEEYVSTNAPLSKLKPSSVSANKDSYTLQDFKKASWLKR